MVWAGFDENSETVVTEIASRDETLLGRGKGNYDKHSETAYVALTLSAHEKRQRGGWLKFPAMVEVLGGAVGHSRADKEGHSQRAGRKDCFSRDHRQVRAVASQKERGRSRE